KNPVRSRQPEELFECDFVVPLVSRIAAQHEDMWVFTHKCGTTATCKPDCRKANLPPPARLRGCSRCRTESKRWGTVSAFGTTHTFDIGGKDVGDVKVAMEVKVVNARGGRMPNGPIQAFLGQCALAASKFDYVIGICGALHSSEMRSTETEKVNQWFRREHD